MAKVEEEVSTAAQNAGADDADVLARYTGPPVPAPRPQGHFLVRFWRSAVGKKWIMAISGIILLGYVLAHMVGNLKVFLGKEHLNVYGEWLRTLGEPAFPRTVLLWGMRIVLIGAFVGHIVAAYQLTRMNQKARPTKYQSKRDYVAANFASRTMRWTGIIVALFVMFHLADLTWGSANPNFVRGDPVRQPLRQLRPRAGRDHLHRLPCWRSGSTSSTARGACSRASGSTTRAGTSGGATSRSRSRSSSRSGNISMPLLITTGVVTK